MINKLKPGDEVAWKERYGGRWHVTKVERVLATQIVTADGKRWMKKHGNEVGAGYDPLYLSEATPERKQAALDHDEREQLATRFNNRVRWAELDLATLRRVKAALDGEPTS